MKQFLSGAGYKHWNTEQDSLGQTVFEEDESWKESLVYAGEEQ